MLSRARILAAAVGVAAAASPAAAGWDNAFQVACFHCKKPRTSNYAPVQSHAAPRQQVQRLPDIEECHDEPVTVMQPFAERVEVPTVERRSYYEPVISGHTTRSYYNPQTCQTETVTVPRTSYVRREECNTVIKYAERISMRPVQTSRKVCSRTPVTQIMQYGPTTSSVQCDNCELPGASGSSRTGPTATVEPARPPRLTIEQDRIPSGSVPVMPQGLSNPKSSRYSGPVTSRTVGRSAAVQGEVVLADRQTPRPNTKVIFLSKSNLDDRIETTTDGFGQFDAALPAGDWYVYLGTGTGRAVYTNAVTVGDAGKNLTLVSK